MQTWCSWAAPFPAHPCDEVLSIADWEERDMGAGVHLDGFDITPMSFHGRMRDVLIAKASGRPVIILHEIFGLSPTVVDFARLLIAAGFKVYMPVLFGSSDP